MTEDTPTRLREIEARLKSAHVAPCSVERRDESDGKISFELWCQPDGAGSLDRVVVFDAHEAISQKYVRARATLYAHVPADIPWLLDQLSAQSAEVERLTERVAALRATVGHAAAYVHHWQVDKAHELKPTDGSLSDAAAMFAAALAKDATP